MVEEQKISNKLMISCEEAALLITMKEEGGELTFYQRIQLFIHNIPCTLCKLWKKESTGLTKIIKNAFNAEKHCMRDEKKAALEKELEELSS